MQNRLTAIFTLFLKIYASYVLGLTILALPITIFINQRVVYSVESPLFSSSILQQNVLDAVRIVVTGQSKSTNFTQFEVQHLKDVHVLFGYFYLVGLIVLILIFRTKIPKPPTKKYYAWSVVAITIITMLAGVFFNTSFEAFHELLFPQGNFAFAWNSQLIQTFPPLFWLLQFLELQLITVLSLLFQFRAAD